MKPFVSELLADHDRSRFSSGNERIDAYFRSGVSQDIRRRYAVCHVLVEASTGRLAGFHTLAANSVGLTDIPPELTAKLPRYPTVPAVLIGWLGRDLAFRGRTIGKLLLADAIHRIVTSPIAAHALIADPIDAAAADFYRNHQFIALSSGRMFLPIATARQIFDLT